MNITVKQLKWCIKKECELIDKYTGRKLTDDDFLELVNAVNELTKFAKENEICARRLRDVLTAIDLEQQSWKVS